MGNVELTEEVVVEPLSPASKLLHEPQFNCYVVAIMGSARRIDVDVVKAGLETTLVHHPRFSSIPVWDEPRCKNPRWVRTKVVLDHHLVIPDLEQQNIGSTPDQFVEDYVASLSTTLDPSHPLWELHLLNFRTAAAAVFRIHHSLGDGVSLISLLLACTRKSSDPGSLPTLPAARRPSNRRRAGAGALLIRARATLALAWNTMVDVVLFVATTAFLQDTQTPLKAAEGVRHRPMRLVHRMVSLDDVKAVKNAMDCTVNDVLVGVTSAGLSRYLNRRYVKSDDNKEKKKNNNKKKNKSLLKNIRLRTTLIANVRPAPGIHALARMMEGDRGGARWGNSIGFVILPFPIVMCKDLLDYVRKGKEIAERKKKSFEAIFTHRSISLVMKLFGSKAAAALSHRLFGQTTLTFSNVVGPLEEIEFFGHPIDYIAPGVFGLPHAITLHFQSYMNKLEIVLVVDELVVPDPHQLLDDLAESLKLIKDAAIARYQR